MVRTFWMKQSRQENIIYLIVWGLLFAAPLLSLYVRMVNDSTVVFDWSEVFIVWRKFALYLVLFLIHNFLLAPLLVHGHRRVTYFSIVAVVVAVFTFYQCNSRPDMKRPMGHRPPMEQMDRHHPPMEQIDRHHPPRGPRPADAPSPIVGEHDIMAIIVFILMLGANLGIKGYFYSRDDRRRLAELEHENLEQQLEYLRYQINPHFFMNTLNNIHALVDIDPCEAKASIVHLSKFMRYLLYESEAEYIPLQQAVDLIHQYISLMSKRYAQKVDIRFTEPDQVPNVGIAPLIVMPFIENAFKHGVSYDKPSFIHMWLKVEEGNVCFGCVNSKNGVKHEYGGVGLANVRKRLDLIYGEHYSLNIDDAENYSVTLIVPAEPISMATGESHNLTKNI